MPRLVRVTDELMSLPEDGTPGWQIALADMELISGPENFGLTEVEVELRRNDFGELFLCLTEPADGGFIAGFYLQG